MTAGNLVINAFAQLIWPKRENRITRSNRPEFLAVVGSQSS